MVVKVGVHGRAGRSLRLDRPDHAPSMGDYAADLSVVARSDTFARKALAGGPVAPALAFALDLFQRFL